MLDPHDKLSQPDFPRRVGVHNGRFVFEDGQEVCLWGVNFQTCLYWEQGFRRAPLGLPGDADSIKAMGLCGFEEIQKLGCDLIRAHLTPADYTDENGHLVENPWLDLIGWTVAEARKRSIYVTLAFLNQMEFSLVRRSFIANCARKDWLFDQPCVDASHTFIRELLNWQNPYTGIRLKDDPVIIAWEPVNEPDYIFYEDMKANPAYRAEFQQWLDKRQGAFNDWYFAHWREEKVRQIIDAFHDLFRSEGAKQPMIWNCNWPRMILRHEDVFRGIAASKTEAVAFCCYPGQDEVSEPFLQGAKDTSGKNYLPFLQRCHDDPVHLGWVNSEPFQNKAVTVYEFETMYNARNAHVIPAMARLFRSLRAQMATLWTYSFSEYAEKFSGSHLFNIRCTPAKAVGFVAAGEIFRNLRIGEPLAFSSQDEDRGDNWLISQVRDLVIFHKAGVLIHSGDIEGTDIPDAPPPSKIIGRGRSPFVECDGTGLYVLEISGAEATLELMPDATFLRDPWQWWMDGKTVTELDWQKAVPFLLKISGWLEQKKFHDQDRAASIPNGEKICPGFYKLK